MATRLLDEQINWYGWKTSSTQALAWPRTGIFDKEGSSIASTTIPAFLRNATAEFARLLISKDRTAENDMKGLKSIRMAEGINIITDKYDRPAVLPSSVWVMIRAYGAMTVYNSRSIVRV